MSPVPGRPLRPEDIRTLFAIADEGVPGTGRVAGAATCRLMARHLIVEDPHAQGSTMYALTDDGLTVLHDLRQRAS